MLEFVLYRISGFTDQTNENEEQRNPSRKWSNCHAQQNINGHIFDTSDDERHSGPVSLLDSVVAHQAENYDLIKI